uniref:CBS domain-containing protein n=1 Tax=Chromera velia CCMP2878 TaxID=1169474 RepID=A0A0G4GP13_9ALVE|eukprot:Cvel_4992.t1-p1 / transcript=Cvel_4992.t1 / gene=Cvel_4992 / organism=Chromera_velia_CCMP2878 / gene_product=hypothetical protein / transcript_product=hypothetical protein / location=Cvel_scaffold226:19307-28936(+) / protein_length=682 / sequence_SO=supercontig / SO=protein_coding / is_pseudo=false
MAEGEREIPHPAPLNPPQREASPPPVIGRGMHPRTDTRLTETAALALWHDLGGGREVGGDLEPPISASLLGLPTEAGWTVHSLLHAKIKDVEHLLDGQQILTLEGDDPVSAFLDSIKMRRGTIRSAVIVEKPKGYRACFRAKDKYSFLDVRDVAYFLMRSHRKWKCKSFPQVLSMVFRERCSVVANTNQKSPFIRHEMGDSVGTVCSALRLCTRVPIFTKDGLLARVFSASDFLKLLLRADLTKHVEQQERRFFSGMVATAEAGTALTLLESETLVKALHVMDVRSFSGIPIVSERDPTKVLDVATVTDIVHLFDVQQRETSRDMLNAPVLEFLRTVRPADRGELVRVRQSCSLRELFDTFLATGSMRVFIVDRQGRMKGMCTLTTVARRLAEVLGSNPRQQTKILSAKERETLNRERIATQILPTDNNPSASLLLSRDGSARPPPSMATPRDGTLSPTNEPGKHPSHHAVHNSDLPGAESGALHHGGPEGRRRPISGRMRTSGGGGAEEDPDPSTMSRCLDEAGPGSGAGANRSQGARLVAAVFGGEGGGARTLAPSGLSDRESMSSPSAPRSPTGVSAARSKSRPAGPSPVSSGRGEQIERQQQREVGDLSGERGRAAVPISRPSEEGPGVQNDPKGGFNVNSGGGGPSSPEPVVRLDSHTSADIERAMRPRATSVQSEG